MDMSKISKQRFSYEDLLKLEPDMTYERLGRIVERLCEEGKITPIKSSGKTSFVPHVYREYKKKSKKKDFSLYLPEIAALHPRLAISRYMGKPEEFAGHREKLLMLSEFWWKQEGLPERMSVKECSYHIWQDEKFMESGEGRKLLSFNGFDRQSLNCYDAPESFFSTRTGKEGMVLVIENKDPWYSLGKALKKSGDGQLCGQAVALLVYGEGNKVVRDGALTQFILDEEGRTDGEVCYAGDIDGAGIGILYGVMRHNPELKLRPFLPLYEAMGRRASGQLEEGRPLKDSGDGRSLPLNREFLTLFAGDLRRVIEGALEANKLIPQEILAYPDYKIMCGH